MVPLRVLVLAETADHARNLLVYARQVTVPLPAHFVVCPLPSMLDALPEPLSDSAEWELTSAQSSDAPEPTLASWPVGLPFAAALQEVIEQYRVTLLVLRSPYASIGVPRRPIITPVLQLLTAPPCAVLLHTPEATSAAPQHLLAVGDGQPATCSWSGTIARTLIEAWRPVIHPCVTGRQPRVVNPARQPWRDILVGMSMEPTVYAVQSLTRLVETVEASHAQMVLLVLRAHGSLERRTTVLMALHSLVPVLLVPALPPRPQITQP